eukprot:3012380-Pyramimonas_sp.AAC.1
MAQDIPRCLKIQDGSQYAPRGPKTAPRRLQAATGPPKEAPPRGQNGSTTLKSIAFDGLLSPQDGPKIGLALD